MDTKPTKKMKFVPKASGRRPPKPVVPKSEVLDDESSAAEELKLRFNDDLAGGKVKNERKFAPARVAFGKGAPSTDNYYNTKTSSSKNQDGGLKTMKKYKDPWDLGSEYPVTLPLREPDAGKPSHLDEKEFGTSDESPGFAGNRMDTATELGLKEMFPEPRLMLVQLPKHIPIKNPRHPGPPEKREHPLISTGSLPAGFMGKLVVYNSGKVKLKLGDVLYDVNPGSDVKFAEDGAVFNCKEKHCSVLGPIHKHMVITPDVNSILDNIADEGVDSVVDGLANADLGLEFLRSLQTRISLISQPPSASLPEPSCADRMRRS